MKKPERRMIDVRPESLSGYDFESSLSSLKDLIQGLIEKYGPDARLDWDPDFYELYNPSPSPKFHVYVRRMENNEEYENRVAQETKRLRENEDRERQEFNRLQKKFGAQK
jgi:hypothetical protein